MFTESRAMMQEGTADRSLLALSVGSFVIGTGMLAVTGMLNELAADLGVSLGAAGQLNSAFAAAVALSAPLLGIATSAIDRRTLLVAALALFAVLHFASAAAPGFAALLALRFAAGFAPAVYTPQAAATAGLLVPPERRGAAISTVFLGFSIATVAGLPLGAYLGAHAGWRFTMASVGAMSVAMMLWLRAVLPADLKVPPLKLRAFRELGEDPVIVLLVAVTAVQSAGQFVLFSYIAPALKSSLGAGPSAIALLLGWFGVFGVAGNSLGARYVDRLGPHRIVAAALVSMLLGLLLWPFAAGSTAATAAALALWGFGCFVTNSAQQVRLVARSARLAPASVAFNSSAIYLGQAVGTAAGGVLLARGALSALSWAASAIVFAAAVLSLIADRLRRGGSAAPR